MHSELQILEHFVGFSEVVTRAAGGGEFDSKGGDHRESVPFSCRLEDATSGNTQQLGVNWENNPVKTGWSAGRSRMLTHARRRYLDVAKATSSTNQWLAGRLADSGSCFGRRTV